MVCAFFKCKVNPLNCKKVDNLSLQATFCTVYFNKKQFILLRTTHMACPHSLTLRLLAWTQSKSGISIGSHWSNQSFTWQWPSNPKYVTMTQQHSSNPLAADQLSSGGWHSITGSQWPLDLQIFFLMHHFPDSYWVKETDRLTHSHTYNINLTH